MPLLHCTCRLLNGARVPRHKPNSGCTRTTDRRRLAGFHARDSPHSPEARTFTAALTLSGRRSAWRKRPACSAKQAAAACSRVCAARSGQLGTHIADEETMAARLVCGEWPAWRLRGGREGAHRLEERRVGREFEHGLDVGESWYNRGATWLRCGLSLGARSKRPAQRELQASYG